MNGIVFWMKLQTTRKKRCSWSGVAFARITEQIHGKQSRLDYQLPGNKLPDKLLNSSGNNLVIFAAGGRGKLFLVGTQTCHLWPQKSFVCLIFSALSCPIGCALDFSDLVWGQNAW